MNPYQDRITADPDACPAIVVEPYHKEHLTTLLDRLSEGISLGKNLNRASVLLSSNPGFGKTHLLARTIAKLQAFCFPISVPPTLHAGSIERDVMGRLLGRLRQISGPQGKGDYLRWLALQMVAATMRLQGNKDGELAWKEFLIADLDSQEMAQHIRKARISLRGGLTESLPQIARQALCEEPSAWALAFVDLLSNDPSAIARCKEWLRGRCLRYPSTTSREDEEDVSPSQQAEAVRDRLFDLIQLFAAVRPLVLIFDQVDSVLSGETEAAKALFFLIERIMAQSPPTQIVLAANAADWHSFLHQAGLPESYFDRLHPPLVLRGLELREALALRDIQAGPQALARAHEKIPDAAVRSHLDVGADGRPRAAWSPRKFLEFCSQRWEDAALPQTTPETVSEPAVNWTQIWEETHAQLLSEPLSFAEQAIDTVLVEILGASREEDGAYHFYRLPGRLLFIEAGSNSGRWGAFSSRARKHAGPDRPVALRPSESLCQVDQIPFREVPGPGWDPRHNLSRMLAEGGLIYHLSPNQMTDLLVAARILGDASDRGLQTENVKSWLREKEAPRWSFLISQGGPEEMTTERDETEKVGKKGQNQTQDWEWAMAQPSIHDATGRLVFPLGSSAEGLVHGDLSDATSAHILLAGGSGSGKSEFLKSLALCLATRNSPDSLWLELIDPGVVTSSTLERLPHLRGAVGTDMTAALRLLSALQAEMELRTIALHREGGDLLDRVEKDSDFPRRIAIFDEFASLPGATLKDRNQFDSLVARLAMRGKAVGIHLVLATSRLDKTAITPTLKSHLPLHLAMPVSTTTQSQLLLGQDGAEKLPLGEMLCDQAGSVFHLNVPLIPPSRIHTLTDRLSNTI